jgi:hypothetical protein
VTDRADGLDPVRDADAGALQRWIHGFGDGAMGYST